MFECSEVGIGFKEVSTSDKNLRKSARGLNRDGKVERRKSGKYKYGISGKSPRGSDGVGVSGQLSRNRISRDDQGCNSGSRETDAIASDGSGHLTSGCISVSVVVGEDQVVHWSWVSA